MLTKVENAFETWEGILKEEMNGELHVAFSLPDAEDGETNAVVRFGIFISIYLLYISYNF